MTIYSDLRQIKRSKESGEVPERLAEGELAINLADRKLFSSDGQNVFEVGSGGGNAEAAYSNAIVFAGLAAGNAYSNSISFSSNADNLTSGTVAVSRLPAANLTSPGIVQLVDSLTNTSITIAAAANAIPRLAATITANASAAYTNATAFSSNADNLTSGVVSDARLPKANLTSNGIVQLVDSLTNTSVTHAAAANAIPRLAATVTANADAAFTNAAARADAAYTNATAFSSNATNLTSGMVADDRLPKANTTANGIVMLVDSLTNTSVTHAAAANAIPRLAATVTANAATAYTNATSFASNADNISSGTLNNARLNQALQVANLTLTTNVATFGNSFFSVSNGNVGIGTSTPSTKLQVTDGSIRIVNGQFLGVATDSASVPSYSWNGRTDMGFYGTTSSIHATVNAITIFSISNTTLTVNAGLTFGSTIASGGANSLARHIALWGETYGFCITSSTLNVVTGRDLAIRHSDNTRIVLANTSQFLIESSATMNVTSANVNIVASLTVNNAIVANSTVTYVKRFRRPRRFEWVPRPGNTTIDIIGLDYSTQGTVTPVSPAFSNVFTQASRVTLLSSNSGTSNSTIFGTQLIVSRDTGFYFNALVGISTITSGNMRGFVGLLGQTTSIGSVQPSTLLNQVSFMFNQGGTVWSARVANSTTTGASNLTFPTRTANADLYEFVLVCEPGSSTITWRARRHNTGEVEAGTLTTNIPEANVLMTPHIWIQSAVSGEAVAIDVSYMYLESLIH